MFPASFSNLLTKGGADQFSGITDKMSGLTTKAVNAASDRTQTAMGVDDKASDAATEEKTKNLTKKILQTQEDNAFQHANSAWDGAKAR